MNKIISTDSNVCHLLPKLYELHSNNVAYYAMAMLEILIKNAYYSDTLKSVPKETAFKACLLHDVGKNNIPDFILNKPGRLTNDERTIMNTHPIYGALVIGSENMHPYITSEEEVFCQLIARTHHERWDGAGYPDMIKGDWIHPFARIVSIADTFDAITSTRPYKEKQTVDYALAEICREAGKQFDAEAVKILAKYTSWVIAAETGVSTLEI